MPVFDIEKLEDPNRVLGSSAFLFCPVSDDGAKESGRRGDYLVVDGRNG